MLEVKQVLSYLGRVDQKVLKRRLKELYEIKMQKVPITIQLDPNKAEVKSDDVFQALFYKEWRGTNRHADIAKQLFQIVASKDHLLDCRYTELSQQFNIPIHEYQLIIRKLKKAHLIRKQKHYFIPDRTFIRQLSKYYQAIRNFYEDCGIMEEEIT